MIHQISSNQFDSAIEDGTDLIKQKISSSKDGDELHLFGEFNNVLGNYLISKDIKVTAKHREQVQINWDNRIHDFLFKVDHPRAKLHYLDIYQEKSSERDQCVLLLTDRANPENIEYINIFIPGK